MISNQTENKRNSIQFFCLESLIPENHIIRKVDEAIDFSFIYDEVSHLYSKDKGRPSVDPVVLFKIVFIQHMFGIRSMRRTIEEIKVNIAYRWFLNLEVNETVPHFSTFAKNYTRRFKDTDIFERIFERILHEAIISGFVDSSSVFIDATHIKACANSKKYKNLEVKIQAKHYQKQLETEVNEDRLNHDKKELKEKKDDDNDDDNGNSINSSKEKAVKPNKSNHKTKNVKQSTTDPDCGLFHKGEHKKCFAYTAHVACDRNNFALSAKMSPGNIHDSVIFDDLYKDIKSKFSKIDVVAVDSGYKTPWIMKQIIDDGKIPATPYKRPMTKKGFFKKYDYVYDEHYDCVICPENQILKYKNTTREGYKHYISNSEICQKCPSLKKCTESKVYEKTYTRHVWQEYIEISEDYRHTPEYREEYKMRSKTIERLFGDLKEKHSMRYTQLKGLKKNKDQLMTVLACMNLLKLARFKSRRDKTAKVSSFFSKFQQIFRIYNKKITKFVVSNYKSLQKKKWLKINLNLKPLLSTVWKAA